jgi:hypothetical protein
VAAARVRHLATAKGGRVGARPDQQLALNFLAVLHELWCEHPGSYVVQENADDLVASLAQMSIKALAADLRDGLPESTKGEEVKGWLERPNGRVALTLLDVLNKIIHGSPTGVEVEEGTIWLKFSNNTPAVGPRWNEAVISATDVLRCLESSLHKHRGSPAEEREQQIKSFLESLGPRRFLPTQADRSEVGGGA